jgi:hypothetical protein
LILDRDETELENMDVDLKKEDCMGIDYKLLSKEHHSTSNSTKISSTPTKTFTKEFLAKDEQIEKDPTPNPMVNDSSNPDKLVMSTNSITDNSFFETFFGRSNVELSSFANSYKQYELLPFNQIVELDYKSWTLYIDISRNEYGVDVGCLLIDLYSNRTYSVI